jgi:hypothetical protein
MVALKSNGARPASNCGLSRRAAATPSSTTAIVASGWPGTWRWEIVDWRPFAHFTCDVAGSRSGKYLGMRDQFDMFEFVPTPEGGTQVV